MQRFPDPGVREAQRCMGWYLATEFLADMIGIKKYPNTHVQGHHTRGYRFLHEQQTPIVALMHGGETMVLGVDEAFPPAMLDHVSRLDDIMLQHLQGQLT